MKPGLELDVLVAEKIFGISARDRFSGRESPVTATQVLAWDAEARSIPRFSTDIAAAWKIIMKIDGQWTIDGQHGIGWEAILVEASMREDRYENPFKGMASSPSHAICLVGLSAVGVSI